MAFLLHHIALVTELLVAMAKGPRTGVLSANGEGGDGKFQVGVLSDERL